jgi:hypothetical protein
MPEENKFVDDVHFRAGWNAALNAIGESMARTIAVMRDAASMSAEMKEGVNSALVWAIAETHRLERDTK